jgi:hypothetical protein
MNIQVKQLVGLTPQDNDANFADVAVFTAVEVTAPRPVGIYNTVPQWCDLSSYQKRSTPGLGQYLSAHPPLLCTKKVHARAWCQYTLAFTLHFAGALVVLVLGNAASEPVRITTRELHSCTKRGVRLFMKRNETFKTCVLNAFSVKRCI